MAVCTGNSLNLSNRYWNWNGPAESFKEWYTLVDSIFMTILGKCMLGVASHPSAFLFFSGKGR